ncbi:class I SAM-dependent methyltransferase [Rubidibacter lacunae]|nr:class I SAM-dependent methyltransferase [Rubidibacter lacunae]
MSSRLAVTAINGLLAVKPLAAVAKRQARQKIVKRAEANGIPWRENVRQLQQQNLQADYDAIANPNLEYPEYYCRPFHAYAEGNLNWQAAWEAESAAMAVHAILCEETGDRGDFKLRRGYTKAFRDRVEIAPQRIVDLGCSVGLSTFELEEIYPEAEITGVDLSPYFLSVAHRRGQERRSSIQWRHSAAETTGLPAGKWDLVSICLVFHELPQQAALAVLKEARRLLKPGGYLTFMDMNPQSEAYKTMPPYVLTLLKSTEPYLDEYFSLDLEGAIASAGFTPPTVRFNSPRHRTLIARAL